MLAGLRSWRRMTSLYWLTCECLVLWVKFSVILMKSVSRHADSEFWKNDCSGLCFKVIPVLAYCNFSFIPRYLVLFSSSSFIYSECGLKSGAYFRMVVESHVISPVVKVLHLVYNSASCKGVCRHWKAVHDIAVYCNVTFIVGSVVETMLERRCAACIWVRKANKLCANHARCPLYIKSLGRLKRVLNAVTFKY